MSESDESTDNGWDTWGEYMAELRQAEAAASRHGPNGWDIDPTEDSAFQSLDNAFMIGNIDLVRNVLTAGFDVNSRVRNEGTVLQLAISRNAGVDLLKLLLESGADVNAATCSGTALSVAVKSSCPHALDVVTLLIEAGASVHWRDSDKATFLHLAAEQAPPESVGGIINMLCEFGIDANVASATGDRPLHAAALRGDAMVAAVRSLLRHGADPNVHNVRGERPIHCAARAVARGCAPGLSPDPPPSELQADGARSVEASPAVISALIERGAVVTHATAHALETPLHVLAICSAAGTAALIAAGADPNAQDACGATPLHAAARLCPPDHLPGVMSAMLCAAADVTLADKDGATALHLLAARAPYHPALCGAAKALVASGADVNARDCRLRTPLHRAAVVRDWLTIRPTVCPGSDDVARSTYDVLTALGGDLTALDCRGRSPFFASILRDEA